MVDSTKREFHCMFLPHFFLLKNLKRKVHSALVIHGVVVYHFSEITIDIVMSVCLDGNTSHIEAEFLKLLNTYTCNFENILKRPSLSPPKLGCSPSFRSKIGLYFK